MKKSFCDRCGVEGTAGSKSVILSNPRKEPRLNLSVAIGCEQGEGSGDLCASCWMQLRELLHEWLDAAGR